jgi:hypothetical protein
VHSNALVACIAAYTDYDILMRRLRNPDRDLFNDIGGLVKEATEAHYHNTSPAGSFVESYCSDVNRLIQHL